MSENTPSDSAVSNFMLLPHFTYMMGSDKGGLLQGVEIAILSQRHPGALEKT